MCLNCHTLINLTPHPVTLNGIVYPPSGTVARVTEERREMYRHLGVPVYATKYGEVTGLPGGADCTASYVSKEPSAYRADADRSPTFPDLPVYCNHADVIYIVSAMVVAACPKRTDLASPCDLERDAEGRIVGARGLTRPLERQAGMCVICEFQPSSEREMVISLIHQDSALAKNGYWTVEMATFDRRVTHRNLGRDAVLLVVIAMINEVKS